MARDILKQTYDYLKMYISSVSHILRTAVHDRRRWIPFCYMADPMRSFADYCWHRTAVTPIVVTISSKNGICLAGRDDTIIF